MMNELYKKINELREKIGCEEVQLTVLDKRILVRAVWIKPIHHYYSSVISEVELNDFLGSPNFFTDNFVNASKAARRKFLDTYEKNLETS